MIDHKEVASSTVEYIHVCTIHVYLYIYTIEQDSPFVINSEIITPSELYPYNGLYIRAIAL